MGSGLKSVKQRLQHIFVEAEVISCP